MNYLIAGTLRHAITSAEIDFGWQRASALPFHWLDDRGALVKGVALPDALASIEAGARVYLGYGWPNVLDLLGLARLISRGVEVFDERGARC